MITVLVTIVTWKTTKTIAQKRKEKVIKMHENLMRDIRRAEKCGLSYGHFKALQRETGEAWKECKAGNPKHFDRVTKRFGRILRTAEKGR